MMPAKILQINAVYGKGSTGNIVKQIHENCLRRGIDSYVAFPKGQGVSDNHTFEIGSFFDHKLHALLSRIAGKQAYYSQIPTLKLLKYIKNLNPDIVHLHNLHSNYINLPILLNYLAANKISTVITMHDCWYFTGGCFHYTSVGCKRWLKECGECPKKKLDTPAYFYDSSQAILEDRRQLLNSIPNLTLIGCSEWITEECRNSALKSKDIRCIHNGFNLEIFKPTESDWDVRLNIKGKFVILAPASKWLLPQNKTALDFIISNIQKDMVLVLFGNPISDIDFPASVQQVGSICNQRELAALYSVADVLVNCSREDTLSSINIEAQACGTPVVTYEATGNKETVAWNSDFAVDTGDYKSLLAEVMEIKRKGKESYTQRCIQFVAENFEQNQNYAKYIDLFGELKNA